MAVLWLGRDASRYRALVVEQRGSAARNQTRPLALERLSRVEEVQAHQPIEEADGHAAAAGRHRESADEVVHGCLLAGVHIVERLGG